MRTIDDAEYIVVGGKADVIAHEQIQQAVTVIIKPQRGSAEALAPEETARTRGIDESSFAGVAEKPALPHASDENVRKTIVVVIADGYTHSIHLDIEACASRRVRKGPVAVVPIEPQRGSLAPVSGPVHAVHKQDVLPAIAVIIEERATCAQGLREQFAAISAAIVPELDTGRVRNIGQAESQGRG